MFGHRHVTPALKVICAFLFGIGPLSIAYAQTTTSKHITTESELPRFSYPIHTEVQQLLESSADEFGKFSQPIRLDVDKTLEDYEIGDHAALRKLLKTRMNLQLLSGENSAALETILQMRALEDKPAAKLTGALNEEAIARSLLAGSGTSNGSCPAQYQTSYQELLNALPWTVAGETMKQVASFAGLMSKPFFIGIVDSELGPVISREHAVTLSGAELIIEARVELLFAVTCKQQTLDVANAYVKAHDIAKADIWVARDAVMPPADKLAPVIVSIWDSGIDTALFPGKLFTDATSDPRDRNGIAFDVMSHRTHGELIPLPPSQQKDYPDFVKVMQAVGDLQAGLDTPAASWFKQKTAAMSPQQMRSFYDEVEIMDGYAHGTHVAGIAARGNPAIRLSYMRMSYDNDNPHRPPTEQLLKDEAASYADSVKWFRDHHVRVVNMSWWDMPSSYEKDLADNGVGKDAAERKQLARHDFEIDRDGLYAALKSAPEILFVTIAGNNNADNAFQEVIPSSFRLPNLIVAGAVDQAGGETGFTSYGENVAVHADGEAVESLVPGGATVRMTGTSMAAPQVTNLAAKLLAIDPTLTPLQIIALIQEGSDTSTDGRRHLINPRRTIELLQSRK